MEWLSKIPPWTDYIFPEFYKKLFKKVDFYNDIIEFERTDPFMIALLEKYVLKRDWEIMEKEWREYRRE